MKTIALLAALSGCLFSGSVSAQDWQPFRAGRTYHFEQLAGDTLYSLRIDSTYVSSGDSVFVFNRTATPWEPQSGQQQTVAENNLFGKQLIRKAGGEYLFLTAANDTFRIKTQAAVGNSWPFTDSITATLTARTVETVLSVPDSVLVISLSNGRELRLSKRFGFVAVHPFMAYLDSRYRYRELRFNALPEAGMGSSTSDPFRIYDFQPGDMFGYYEWQQNWLGTPPIFCCDFYRKHKVMSRYDSPDGDSIIYVIATQTRSELCNGASPQFYVCNGSNGPIVEPPYNYTLTITRSGPDYKFLSVPTLSWEVFSNSGNSLAVKENSTASQMHGRQSHLFVLYDAPTPWQPQLFQVPVDWYQENTYTEGLGLTKVYVYSLTELGQDLICYTKGTETWGNCAPFANLLDEEEELAKPVLSVFPNPANNEVTIRLPDGIAMVAKAQLRNALGQTVWQGAAAQEQTISLAGHAAGIYLLTVSSSAGTWHTKVVKE